MQGRGLGHGNRTHGALCRWYPHPSEIKQKTHSKRLPQSVTQTVTHYVIPLKVTFRRACPSGCWMGRCRFLNHLIQPLRSSKTKHVLKNTGDIGRHSSSDIITRKDSSIHFDQNLVKYICAQKRRRKGNTTKQVVDLWLFILFFPVVYNFLFKKS